uniref:Uncharacterized protein n=1 Tax=Arundo donax TaxID=35708 RepID=A0A0A8YNQ1_ARUDO
MGIFFTFLAKDTKLSD